MSSQSLTQQKSFSTN